jgi:hypothetical protein
MDSSFCLWRSETEDQDVTVYLDATLTHLFKTRQTRTFDLRGKPLSRYMLAMKFTSSVENLKVTPTFTPNPLTAQVPSAQFDNLYTPVANLTTIPCTVSAAVQGEVILKIAYTWKHLQWDFGYNFWGRSCLKIAPMHTCSPLDTSSWGLKGDAFVYGFATNFSPLSVNPTGIPLSATESNATIFAGTNRAYDLSFSLPPVIESTKWNMNYGVDNPGWAYNASNLSLTTHIVDQQDPITHQALWLATQSSLQPVLLTPDDIDVHGAQTNSYSNKFFMHASYTWHEFPAWEPYFGAGGEIEFGSQEPCCCRSSSHMSCQALAAAAHKQDCCLKSCRTISLSQWGIWLKAGFSYK